MRARHLLARPPTAAAAILATGSGVLSALRLVPARGLPARSDTVAMLSAFTDYAAPGFALATVSALTGLALRGGRLRSVLAVGCLTATALQVVVLAPRWGPAPTLPHRASFTVLALNSRLGHADPAALVEAASGADVVVLTEVNARQVHALDQLGFAERFPHRSAGPLPAEGGAGTAVFSTFRITSTRQLSPEIKNQSWTTTLDVPGASEPVTVVAVHPARPYRGQHRWLHEQDALRAALPTTGPRLLAGDFNAVASHPTQRALVRDGWTSAVDQTGSGWVPTYPADSSRLPPLLDIDHVYVSAGLQATSLRTVRVTGTDHLGLLATIDVTGRPPAT